MSKKSTKKIKKDKKQVVKSSQIFFNSARKFDFLLTSIGVVSKINCLISFKLNYYKE